MLNEVLRALESQDVEIRRSAVLSLAGASAQSAEERKGRIGVLLKALTDQSWRVRKTAQDMLMEEYRADEYAEPLIGLLHADDNAGARNAAIETLTRLNKRVTAYLIKAFRTNDSDARKFIIDILGEFRDPRALPVMLDALKDEDDNVRASAVEHLGTMGEPTVVDALVEILEGEDFWTAYPAADALGRIGDKRAIPALLGALSRKPLREPALRALGALGDDAAVKHVVPFIKDHSRVIQEEALRTVEKLYHRGISADVIADVLREQYGDEAIGVLVEHAWSSKTDVRVSAILLLGLLRDERAFDNLLELSIEEDFTENASRAFVFISRQKPEALLPLFDRENPNLRRFIVRVAGLVAHPLYFEVLVRFLGDEDGHVRALAAKGLARMGDARAMPHLKSLLSDAYEDVQAAAVEALCSMKAWLDTAGLIGLLESRDFTLRKNAALILGSIASDEAVSALGFALKDENKHVRKAVIAALSSIKTEESTRYLISALTDEAPDIRASSATALGAIGGQHAFESLTLLLADSEDMVRAASAKALGMLGLRDAVPCLLDLLYDPNGFVVTVAMNALGRLGGEEAEAALVKMLSSKDKELRRTAIKALFGFKDAAGHVAAFLNDPDWATRIAAIEVIGEHGAFRGELERLLDSEEDPVVRKTIERLLRQ